MNIENICNFFYQKTSIRIKNRLDMYKSKTHLKNEDIYPNDPKQISHIICNRRTKNNRFLVTDAILISYDQEASFGLVPKLGFQNCQEVLWGNDEEIIAYLSELFRLLWNEIEENNEYHLDKEELLYDYVPYAKYSTYYKILYSKENIYPAFYYGMREDDILNHLDSATEFALCHLYNRCSKDFVSIFKKFANETKSYHKLNTVLKKQFIDSLFIPMLINAKPNESSLGVRVKNLIRADLSLCASIITGDKSTSKICRDLLRASSSYVLALEQIQNSF